MIIFGKKVIGAMDPHTRCKHYATEKDIIAIKFRCCGEYYPCHLCHEELAGHQAEVWGKGERRGERAVLCGNCGYELGVEEYINSNSVCPRCEASFNPRCHHHLHLYFEM